MSGTVVDWELHRAPAGANVTETNLVDVLVRDTFNRFAKEAQCVIDDFDGSRRALYPELTPVLFRCKLDTDGGFSDRWGGYVSNPRQEGNQLILDCLSHDGWLRRRQVFLTFTGVLISSILNTLITTLTPLNWVPAQVTVVNDAIITRTWRGESLDVVIQELAGLSAGEEFGADDSANFFFRQPSVTNAPYGFPDGSYADTDFDKNSSREINRVTLYYGTSPSTGAVTVQDLARQSALQALLGSPQPVVSEFTTTYPEITTEASAKAKATGLLGQNVTIVRGSITTWEALQHRPGQVMSVVVNEKAINGSYRLAAIEYRWKEDKTVIKMAENRQGVVDVLIALSGEVTRIDNRAADVNAAIVDFVEIEADINMSTHLQVITRSYPNDIWLFGIRGFGNLDNPQGKLGDRLGAPVIVYGED